MNLGIAVVMIVVAPQLRGEAVVLDRWHGNRYLGFARVIMR